MTPKRQTFRPCFGVFVYSFRYIINVLYLFIIFGAIKKANFRIRGIFCNYLKVSVSDSFRVSDSILVETDNVTALPLSFGEYCQYIGFCLAPINCISLCHSFVSAYWSESGEEYWNALLCFQLFVPRMPFLLLLKCHADNVWVLQLRYWFSL